MNRNSDDPSSLEPEHNNCRQLLVDISVIYKHDARTGIQRVVRGVWNQLRKKQLTGYELRPVFATARQPYCYAPEDFLDTTASQSTFPHIQVEMHEGDLFLGLDLAAHLLPRHIWQITEWRKAGGLIHLLVYDLLPVTNGRWFSRRARKNFKSWLGIVAHLSDQAICISQHVASELRTWLYSQGKNNASIPLISSIRLGADVQATSPTRGIPAQANLVRSALAGAPGVLMIGTVEPRKGYGCAVSAFERLWRANGETSPVLIIAGKPGWKTRWLQWRLRHHPEGGKKLFWIEDASDEFLEQLYEACEGLLCTSYAEGFGLPIAEAMAHGMPILMRDIPVFREFEGQHNAYFNDDRPSTLSHAIEAWLDDIAKLDRITIAEPQPSWADTTRQLLALLDVACAALPHEETVHRRR